jgi:imidazole glycerol phosphate synthase subunit HisF
LAVLSEVAFARENAEEGARLALGAADAASTAGFTWWRGVTLLGASEALLALGQLGKAGAFFPDGLDALRSVHDLVNLPIALGVGAALAAQLGDAARAGTLWGALEAEIDREPRATSVSAREGYEPYLEPVRSDVFEEARLRGRTLSLEDAVAYALGKQT